MVGCPYTGTGEEFCHESCLAARLRGDDRVCADSEYDPAKDDTENAPDLDDFPEHYKMNGYYAA